MGKIHKFVEAPTLYPSDEDFSDPIRFLSQTAIKSLAELYGVLKIVPPKGWKPKFSINEESFRFHTRLQNLAELNLQNRPKIFFFESLNNYLKMKKKGRVSSEILTLREGQTIDLYLLFQITDYEASSNKDNFIEWRRVSSFFGLSLDDDQLKEYYEQYLRGYSKYLKRKKHLLSNMRQEEENDNDHCLICFKKDDPQHTLICDGCEESYHMRCLTPPMKRVPESDWYCDACLVGTFDYGFEEDFDSLYTIGEFKKHCDKFEKDYFMKRYGTEIKPSIDVLEKEFWRLVDGTTVDELDKKLEMRYGADIHNYKLDEISGFPTSSNPSIDIEDPAIKSYINHPFNLTNLPFAEGSLLNYIKDSEISGMTVPWIYVGSLFSTFCWHKEDHYTMSSNYCHFGSTKKWYGIPAKYEGLFEKIIMNCAPEYFQRQPDLLHQLITLLSPAQIFERAKDEDLTIVYANQNENEFVITYPKVYHAGFNSGLNFNELVNFTMPYWIKDADKAINDYKKVHKENVFNYYQLSQRIMDEFLKLSSGEILNLNTRYKGDYLKMISTCFKDFKKEFRSSNTLNNQIFSYAPDIRETEYVPVSKEELTGPKKRGRKKKSVKEDELLCDVCKTFLSFRWVIFSNKTDYANRKVPENIQLLSPDQTPKIGIEEVKPCEESEFQKIINEAKKLTNITEGRPGMGLAISVKAVDTDEPLLKRRKSTRLEKLKLLPAKSVKTTNFESEELTMARKNSAKTTTTIKLCLADFMLLIGEDDSEALKKLLRAFDNDNVNFLIKNYGSVIFDCDESKVSQFVDEVGEKLGNFPSS